MGTKYDVAPLYGLSTPHFDVFSIVGVVAPAAESLAEDGSCWSKRAIGFTAWRSLSRYREIFCEGNEGRGVLLIQVGCDPLRGVVEKATTRSADG